MISTVLNYLLDLNRPAKRIIQLAFDVVMIIICYVSAMALRYDGSYFLSLPRVWDVLLYVVPVTLFVFIRSGFYRAVLRYISSRAMKTMIVGVGISAVTMFVADQLLVLPVPRSVPAIYAFLLFGAIGGSRFGWRYLYRLKTARPTENIVICGAGEEGQKLLETIKSDRNFNVVAFIDPNRALQNQDIGSVKVFPVDDLEDIKDKYDVSTLLLAIPNASRSQRQNIIARSEKLLLKVRNMPAISDLVSGRTEVNALKIVEAGQLLERDVVPPNPVLMQANITDKVVMVTGAGGSIGSEICRQVLQQKPKCLVLYDVSEYALYTINDELQELSQNTEILPLLGSVQNPSRLSSTLKALQVHTIYHAAAYKHVPLFEQNIVEGIRNNIFGTKILLENAVANGVKSFTLVSTDKAVRPTSFMGASKRIAELICQSMAANQSDMVISMVRFGNVLGSSGSVIPRFEQQIKKGGPVTVTHRNITRFFMTISEASQLVIQAGAMARGGDVFVLDMGKPVEIAKLAERMIRLQGLRPYLEDDSAEDVAEGDVCIKFTGLRPGEKLYEELLIGNNPKGTQHPRILSADEILLDSDVLEPVLTRLFAACQAFDIDLIREIFLKLPLEFTPDRQSCDLLWRMSATDERSSDRADSNVIELNRGG